MSDTGIGFIGEQLDIKPNVFLQWKGTDACFDFLCECGARCHFDGYFAYTVKCPHCKEIWEMPCIMYPRKVTDENQKQNAVTLEPDEDMEIAE